MFSWISIVITQATLNSYLLFYTMYSKAEKKLVPAQLIEIMTLKAGWTKFLVEMNKAISLSGLTTLCLAFCPGIDKTDGLKKDLIYLSLI